MAAAAAAAVTLRARAVEKGAPPELPEGALERWLNFFDAEPAKTQFVDGRLYLAVRAARAAAAATTPFGRCTPC
jgi:hypothetical protein